MPIVTPKFAANVFAVGFGIAGAALSVRNREVGEGSRWGQSGWQREIIIWNAGTVTAVAAMRAFPEEPDRGLTIGFTTLSTLFRLNHLAAIAFERGGGTRTHLEAIALNLGGIAAGVVALRAKHS